MDSEMLLFIIQLCFYLIIVFTLTFAINFNAFALLCKINQNIKERENLEYKYIYKNISYDLSYYKNFSFLVYIIIFSICIFSFINIIFTVIPYLILITLEIFLFSINRKISKSNTNSIKTLTNIRENRKLLFIFNECSNPDIIKINNICFGENIVFVNKSGLLCEYSDITECIVSKTNTYLFVKVKDKIIINKQCSVKNLPKIQYILTEKKVNFSYVL